VKKVLLSVFILSFLRGIYAQIDTNRSAFGEINLQNYSTSFNNENGQTTPFLIVARYNPGMYTAGLDMDDAFPQYRNKSIEKGDDLTIYDTNDSSEVHFIVANVYRNTAQNYEFKVWSIKII
jgi:hypothetical protein